MPGGCPLLDLRDRALGRVLRVVLCALLLCAPLTSLAANDDDLNAPPEIVEYTGRDTLRSLVGRHMGDPDLWPAVLSLNGFASPSALVPGAQLLLPVSQVRAADRALLASLQAIQSATAEGARIFAPVEIGAAIDNRDSAISSRAVGAWRDSVNFSDVATGYAQEALTVSLAQRDRAAEAIVSDVQGRVEGRTPVEPQWSNRRLNDVLVEFERLRTLSSSTTQITFRDLSRLRLNPNSNATIQRMRTDPLTGGEVTKVSLVNGDFYALLNQLSEKTQFEIEVPGVETTTNSADFWIKNDASGARFVNYDSPQLEVSTGDSTILVGENEGVVLTSQGAERTEVLNAPRLTSPRPGYVSYDDVSLLAWDAFEGAEGYWLEIARDPGFNQMQVSEWGLRDTGFAASLPPDQYHWRVAALDRLGLPGEWSTERDFVVRTDTTPPFLTVLAPNDNAITDERSISFIGSSEPDATVTLNGQAVGLDTDGSFAVDVALTPGPNGVLLTATDLAGNETTRARTIVYRPNALIGITLSDDIARVGDALATRSDALSVLGETTAESGARVLVLDDADAAVVLETTVGQAGTLGFSVPVAEAPRGYRIQVLSPNGAVEGSLDFTALKDRTPPVLVLDQPPPRATVDGAVDISGDAGDAARLDVNGASVDLIDGRFALRQDLAPGANQIELVAVDAVGNVSALEFKTVLDNEPPEILRVDLGRPNGADGPIELVVEARDESGLVLAAPYVVSVAGVERDGFLRCDSRTGICRSSLPAEPGALKVIELTIEDYAGNATFR